MNKNLFKVIFNKKRGQMMAVAENTIREGKSTADSTAGSTVIVKSTIRIAGLPVLAWSILLGFGLCTLVIDSGWAGSIHADTSAPKSQQPTILQTANGTPQINIRTPTKGGVSINQFRQMDVDKKGAILNNSRKNTETRLAGWIQANPWLSKGEARVIVNQINSTNPSQLNGYIEVAGRRAEVIIANPAGINVNGSGFINAAGVTLTTGKPLIKNGNLDGFEVRQGNISIGGDGLDTGSSEYTRILSQAAQINAGIWANNLNITAGSNNTDVQGNITESVLTSAENKPLVAIDAGKLGGMYAGKIVLVSTDKGVGVNNAGQIYAGNGNLSIDANGYLSNSGSIVVSDQKSSGADIASVSLNADRVMNSGTVSSQGKMLVHSEQLENSGLLTTADEINLRQQKLYNQGEINAGRIDIIADNIHNQNGKIIQTGTQSLTLDLNKLNNRNNGLISYEPRPDESALPEPNIPISLEPGNQPEPAKPVTPPTTATGGGQIVPADNTHKTQFETGQIISNQEIINDNGQIVASGGIDLTSKAGLNNHGSLNLNKLTVSGEIFDNYQGKLSARQALINTDSIDNHEGEIITAESLSAKSGKLDNRKGKLQSVKGIDIDSAQLDNSDNGLIAAQEQLSIQSEEINNSLDGKIQSGASLKLNTNNLNNQQGSIDSNSLILKADIVDNSKGAIRTNQQLNAQIGSSLNNQGGEFGSGGDVLLNSEGESHLAVDNSDGGKIIAGKNAYLNTESIKNNNKGIISGENLDLKAARAENTAGGVIQAGKQLKAQIEEKLDNTGGNIVSNEELLLNADGQSNLVLNNSANGKIQAGKHAVIHTTTLDNSNNGSIDADSIDLTANSVNNAAGAIRANQQLKVQISSSLNNQGGEFGSGGDVLLNSEGESHLAVDNSDDGKIIAGKYAYLNTESIKNNNKGIISSENLNLKAARAENTAGGIIQAGKQLTAQIDEKLDNTGGNIASNEELLLNADGPSNLVLNNSANGKIQAGKGAVIHASTLDNSSNGSIDVDRIDLIADSVNNAAGAIRTNRQLKAQIGSSLNNQGGEFGSGGDVLLNSEGESHLAVDNSEGGKIIAGKDAYLNTESIKNNNKGIISSENLYLKASVSVNNSTNGVIQSGKEAVIQTATLDNSSNGSIDADSIDLTADSVNNAAGAIRTNRQLKAQIGNSLNNQGGEFGSSGDVLLNSEGESYLAVDNSNGGKIIAGKDAYLNTESIKNNNKGIISSEKNLNLKAARVENKSEGIIQAGKQLKAQIDEKLDNTGGNIVSNEELLLNADGPGNLVLNNSANGQIQAGKHAVIHTATLDNSNNGSIDAGSSDNLSEGSLDLIADSVNNAAGAIRANQQLKAQIGNSLNNQGGEFGGNGDVLLNSEGESHLAVDNSDGGKIIAGKDAYLNTASIKNNNKGIISSENLNLKAVRAENTAGGVIQAGKQLKAQIDEKLDNTGGEFKSNEELLLNADGQSNLVLNNSANGQIQAGKHAVIHTATLDNSNNGSIDADSIDLTADSIDNTAGNIRANKQLNAQINQKLLNQYGQISSADNVNIHDQLHNTLEIDNTNNGKILAGNDLNLQAKKLDYASTDDAGIAAGHDASIDLTDDFNINGNISANAGLKLHSNGKIINNHNVIGDSVIIDASRIDNQADGTIQSNKHTELNVQDSVINRGLINSNGLTLIQAGNFVDNVGTGRIYGDHVAIGTGSLLNREEVTGNETKAATIAARQKLDIGARDIVNREQGSLLSEGDLAIGGKLDEQYHAIGMADSLINSSARIEAKGNGNIAVNELRNLNNHFALEEYLANSEQHIQQYLFPGQTEKWTEGVDGHFNERGEGHKHSEFYFNDGRPTVTEKKTDISWWDFNRNTYKQRVSESSPGEIIIGGNLNISGSHWENNNSRILVGGNLTGADSLQLDNIESKGQQRVVDTGTTGGYKKSKKGGLLNRHDVYKRKVRGEINETTITTIDLENPVSIIQQHTKGDSKDNSIAGVNNNTSNVEKAGSAYTGDSSIDGLNSNGNRNQDTNTITSNNSGTDNVNVNYTGSNDYYLSANNQPVGDNQTEGAKVPSIKTLINLNTKLPNSSFYHIDPDNKGYLIEADPAFTNKNKWLSSNYMLEALGQDPEKLQKRLGDGYYEQRLINEQIDQLTGYRRLAGYESDEDEYKALMDAGVSMAKAIGLVPGIALSADQMARLTSDIVWMVSQTVTMPDGSQQSVLVPQVYLMVRDGDLNTAGALISADNISLHTNKDINNQGTVAGRKVVDLGAHNLSNSGLISGKTVLANAANNIDINGGTVQAQDMLSLQAQRINVNTTTATHGDERNGGTVIDRVAGLYVTGGKNGILAVNSVEDLNFHGANIVNTATNGLTQLASSNGSVNLGTVQTASHSGYGELSARNHLALDHKDEIGTQVIADGNVSLTGNKVNIRQSDINSTNGNINIYGKEGVNITEGRAKTDLDEAHYNKTRGTFSTKKSIDKYQKHNDEAKGSTITGSNISIGSEQDINIRGSNVIADNQTVLRAGNNITVEAAENQYEGQEYHARKKSGLMGSGGFGFFIGSQKQTDDTTNKSLIHSGSSVGSLKGDTTVIAGNHYTQSGSTVSSTEGNVTVVAKQINVQAAQDQYSTDYVHTMKQSGITVGVNSPVVSSVQKAGAAVERINKSKNDRVNAMAAFNAGMDTYKAGSAVADIANNPQNAMNASVGITVGQQKVRMESHTKDTVASASRINAGGTVNLLATGAGKDSNINIIGSDVAGSKGTHFQADNEINLLAAEQNHSERSSNKSSGWSAGMNIGYGTGSSALGLTAGANRGKGHSNGDETSYRNSHVGSSSGSTSLSSGGATNIMGAQVIGKGVSMDAAELNAASLQDKARYDSKQENTSGQVTVGYGASGSASYSKSKIKADYAGVTEQSGIIAGDDGYQIKVKGNTDLKGAIITSASAAEAAGKNSLITGSLTSSDIKNHSDYSGSSIGIGASGNYHGGWDNSSINSQTGESISNVNETVGYGSDSGHTSSITHSGINTGNIIITDEAAHQQKTGKTVAETIAAIHTDISSEDYADKAGYLHNNFDKDKVQKELDLQREISQEFSDNMQTASAIINSKKDALKEKLKNTALSPEEREKYEKELSQWNAGGLLLNAIGAGLSAPTNSIGGIVAATASPIVSYQIGQYFKGKDAEGSTAHTLAHAVVGAAVAAAGGNDAVTGGIAAAGTEVLAPAVSKWLYGKDTKDLTSDEKNTISSIVGLAGAATGVAVGGSMTDVAQGNQAGLTSVDNNSLATLIKDPRFWTIISSPDEIVPDDIRYLIVNYYRDEDIEKKYKDINKLKQDIESGDLKFDKTVADLVYRMNQDPNLIIKLPSDKKLAVRLPWGAKDGEWRPNKSLPSEEVSNGYVMGWDDWGVFGNVTVSRDKNDKQKIRIIDDTYDFDMHKENDLRTILRNEETKLGAPYEGTSYKIHFNKITPTIYYEHPYYIESPF